jgi:hypothetical protein
MSIVYTNQHFDGLAWGLFVYTTKGGGERRGKDKEDERELNTLKYSGPSPVISKNEVVLTHCGSHEQAPRLVTVNI